MRHSFVALFIVLAASSALARPAAPRPAAPPLEGKVTQVIDGATVVFEGADGKALTVRLAGIEVPEPCQTWGPESRDALKEWTQGEAVTLRISGKGSAGRVTGNLSVDGADLSRRMVEEGHAFSARTKWDHGPYVKQEHVAHSLSRGMYSTGLVQTPAEFRREHGPCAPAPK